VILSSFLTMAVRCCILQQTTYVCKGETRRRGRARRAQRVPGGAFCARRRLAAPLPFGYLPTSERTPQGHIPEPHGRTSRPDRSTPHGSVFPQSIAFGRTCSAPHPRLASPALARGRPAARIAASAAALPFARTRGDPAREE